MADLEILINKLKLESIIERRNGIAEAYDQTLSTLGFERQFVTKDVYHNIQSLVFTVPNGVNHDELIDNLLEHYPAMTALMSLLSRWQSRIF